MKMKLDFITGPTSDEPVIPEGLISPVTPATTNGTHSLSHPFQVLQPTPQSLQTVEPAQTITATHDSRQGPLIVNQQEPWTVSPSQPSIPQDGLEPDVKDGSHKRKRGNSFWDTVLLENDVSERQEDVKNPTITNISPGVSFSSPLSVKRPRTTPSASALPHPTDTNMYSGPSNTTPAANNTCTPAGMEGFDAHNGISSSAITRSRCVSAENVEKKASGACGSALPGASSLLQFAAIATVVPPVSRRVRLGEENVNRGESSGAGPSRNGEEEQVVENRRSEGREGLQSLASGSGSGSGLSGGSVGGGENAQDTREGGEEHVSRNAEGRFECSLCELSFQQRGGLRNHVRTVHNGEKRYVCWKGCGQRFGARGDVTRHVDSVHERRRPFTCPVCKAKLCRKSVLKRHLKNHHPGVVVPGLEVDGRRGRRRRRGG